MLRRMRGDDALSSSAALIFGKFIAKSAVNFAMKWRSRGRGFKSLLLHHLVSRSADIAENRSKSARVRAICDRARTQRAALFLQFAESGQFLSRRDLPRSADHRHTFALEKIASSETTGLSPQSSLFFFLEDSFSASVDRGLPDALVTLRGVDRIAWCPN